MLYIDQYLEDQDVQNRRQSELIAAIRADVEALKEAQLTTADKAALDAIAATRASITQRLEEVAALSKQVPL